MRNSIVGSNTHRSLSVKEFRGFAIADEYAPLIFLNSSDANNAKIFTLAHELAHLWINQSGISFVDLEELSNNDIEKFCNAVSAEVLVPENDFKAIWKSTYSLEENSTSTAEIFKVSNFVTARRAFELNLISKIEFFQYYREESERFEQSRQHKKNERSAGGSYYANIHTRNGRRFSQAVVVSALEGKLPYREAATLVNINASKMSEFAKVVGVK
jgi:Zn-dependent peptidase ImmA (M78 family)